MYKFAPFTVSSISVGTDYLQNYILLRYPSTAVSIRVVPKVFQSFLFVSNLVRVVKYFLRSFCDLMRISLKGTRARSLTTFEVHVAANVR